MHILCYTPATLDDEIPFMNTRIIKDMPKIFNVYINSDDYSGDDLEVEIWTNLNKDEWEGHKMILYPYSTVWRELPDKITYPICDTVTHIEENTGYRGVVYISPKRVGKYKYTIRWRTGGDWNWVGEYHDIDLYVEHNKYVTCNTCNRQTDRCYMQEGDIMCSICFIQSLPR